MTCTTLNLRLEITKHTIRRDGNESNHQGEGLTVSLSKREFVRRMVRTQKPIPCSLSSLRKTLSNNNKPFQISSLVSSNIYLMIVSYPLPADLQHRGGRHRTRVHVHFLDRTKSVLDSDDNPIIMTATVVEKSRIIVDADIHDIEIYSKAYVSRYPIC